LAAKLALLIEANRQEVAVMDELGIFTRALDIERPQERAAFLEQTCGTDATLRARVEALLQSHQAAGSFLQNSPLAGKSPTVDQRPLESPGTVIGPYKLLQQIGEGGMGVVYMAEQLEPVKRRVALKIIKPGMDTRQVIARFEAERQALALMDHVNIARVLDAGTTEQGRPYFVMELVHGMPITKYCDDSRLTPRQRLELFVPICPAIQHAHQKGIIHRDIKPSNVMVTLYDGQPVPKVIDFGVAKATEQKLTERTLFTQYGTMVGTLEYMSPEQAEMSALGVDTRSDIYSLGVLLYELLTGNTPLTHLRMKEAAYGEILRMIKEDEPPKPSTRLSDSGEALASISANRHTEPAKLTKLVRGELDWIVMKTLEKDRNRRYETANGFAMDVQRYLDDEPVQASPASVAYRFRKFARRNKRAIATMVVLILAVLAVSGTLGWAVRDRDARAEESARDRATLAREATRERAAREAAMEVEVKLALQEAERWQEQAKWPEALSAAKRAEGLLAGGGSNELRERVHQFRKDLDLVLRLEEFRAHRQHSLDHETLNGAYVSLFLDYGIDVENLSPPEIAAQIARRPATAVRVAGALDDWAQVLRDWGLRDRTRAPAAWKRLLEAARLADPDPWRSQLRQLTGQGDLPALRKLADESDMEVLPVQSLQQMGNHLIFSGDGPACVEWLRKAHRQHPGDALISFDLAWHLSHLPSADLAEVLRFAEAGLAAQPSPFMYTFVGGILNRLGRQAEAVAVCRKAIELRPDYYGAHFQLGNALHHQGKSDAAIAEYRKAIDLNPQDTYGHINLGNALRQHGKLDEAIAAYRAAIRLQQDYAYGHHSLEMNRQYGQHDFKGAIAVFRKAIDLNPKDAQTHNDLGCALSHHGKVDEAIVAFKEATRLNPGNAYAHHSLGLILHGKNDYEGAIACFNKTIQLDPKKFQVHNSLGLLLSDLARYQEAEVPLREAIRLAPNQGWAYYRLGHVLKMLKRFDEAVPLSQEAIRLIPDYEFCHVSLADNYQRSGRWDASYPVLQEALRINPDWSAIHFHLGRYYQHKGQTGEALKELQESLRSGSGGSWYRHRKHYYLAQALQTAGQLDEAVEHYEKSIIARIDQQDVFADLAVALARSGKWDRASEIYQSAGRATIRPGQRDMRWVLLDRILALANVQLDTAEVQILYRAHVERTSPADWTAALARSLLGGTLLGQQKYAEAEPWLLAGYEGLKEHRDDIPASAQGILTEAVERLIQLYSGWEKKDEGERWRNELQTLKGSMPIEKQGQK
jgi:serine/threonine protein kinase/Flp pilus assembly protein TadD